MKRWMRSRQMFVWLVVLTLGCVFLLAPPIQAQSSSVQSNLPLPSLASRSSPPLSSLRINPQRLETLLNRRQVSSAIQHLELGWKQQFDEFYQNVLTVPLLSTNQIAQSLTQSQRMTGKRTALIYAIALPKHLEVILLLPNQQLVHRRISQANVERVEAITRTFRAEVSRPISRPSDYLPPAQQLYQWLITPLKADLQAQGIDQLLFCLGRGLRSIPVAALHDGEQFLIEQYSLGIIPAFNLLNRSPSQLPETQVLAMGASEFAAQNPLPAVPLELAAIARLWSAETWLNQQFTLQKLQQRRSQVPFGIVHLATHATFAAGSVQRSYIQFWDKPLRLNQLQEMNLRSPLVEMLVLSACRTALGDPNAELGFAGLAVQSGAKAAVASLWSVNDGAAFALMVAFYEQLKTAPTKGEALRQAQLAMLRGDLQLQGSTIQRAIGETNIPTELLNATPNLTHPNNWAAFTMIGNPW